MGTVVMKEDTVQINEKFKKREFVVEVENERNSDWNDFIKTQVTQDRCSLLDNLSLGDQVKVSYNIRGRKYEKDGETRYFVSIETWRIEKTNNDSVENSNNNSGSELGSADINSDDDEDIPF